jgi:transposase
VTDTITSYVGLDIHKDSIAIAVADAGRAPPRFIGTTDAELTTLCRALGRVSRAQSTLVVYEAGPCGYGWARHLKAHGWRCEIIAPSHIVRSPNEKRTKTDRRDALLLARQSRAGDLVKVAAPDERDEAIRDLTRARGDALTARLRARHQLKAMLLRHGHAYRGKTSWTQAHERFLAAVSFPHEAQDIAFGEYRQSVKDADERVGRITEALRVQSSEWRMKPVVDALMCMRGFDLVAAVSFIAEIGDLTRFAHPRQLMSYLGLVPSEYSSGQTRRQGAITKAGNVHARRILIEAAWNYRHGAKISRTIEARQQGRPKLVRDIAWRAQLRLSQRYRRLSFGRHLPQNKVCVAIARELTGFIWDIARQVTISN